MDDDIVAGLIMATLDEIALMAAVAARIASAILVGKILLLWV